MTNEQDNDPLAVDPLAVDTPPPIDPDRVGLSMAETRAISRGCITPALLTLMQNCTFTDAELDLLKEETDFFYRLLAERDPEAAVAYLEAKKDWLSRMAIQRPSLVHHYGIETAKAAVNVGVGAVLAYGLGYLG